MVARLYVVKHRTCGHVVQVGNDRAQGREMLDRLQATGNYGWRLLAIVGEAEIEQALRLIVTDEMCGTCRVVVPS